MLGEETPVGQEARLFTSLEVFCTGVGARDAYAIKNTENLYTIDALHTLIDIDMPLHLTFDIDMP